MAAIEGDQVPPVEEEGSLNALIRAIRVTDYFAGEVRHKVRIEVAFETQEEADEFYDHIQNHTVELTVTDDPYVEDHRGEYKR